MENVVKIYKNYYLRWDNYQWILSKKLNTLRENGDKRFENYGYFTSFDSLIKRLIEYDLKDSNSKTIEDIKNNLDLIRKGLAETITLPKEFIIMIKEEGCL